MAKAKEQSSFSNLLSFFPEAWAELKKVHTPTREETIRATIGAIAMVVVFGIFLGLTDFVVGSFVRTVMGLD